MLKHPLLKKLLTTSEENITLRDLIVEYTGEKLKPEDNKVDVEMVFDIFSEEFPEFLQILAEENFFRGYNQALQDKEEVKDEEGKK